MSFMYCNAASWIPFWLPESQILIGRLSNNAVPDKIASYLVSVFYGFSRLLGLWQRMKYCSFQENFEAKIDTKFRNKLRNLKN